MAGAVAGQAGRELRGAGRTVGGELRQRREDRGFHRLGDRVPHAGRRSRLLGHYLGDDRLHGGAEEGGIADEHFVGHTSERVDVAPGPDLALAHRLLGTHVMRGTEAHAGLGHPGAAAGAAYGERDPEIRYQRGAVMQENVFGLDVAVDDAMPVSIVECRCDFGRDADRIGHRQLLFPVQSVAQALAFDVRHDVVGGPVRLTRVDQAEDVRVLQRRDRADLAHEAFGPDHGGKFRLEDLDGHLAAVPEVLRQVDGGHPAGAELALDPVAVGQGGRKPGGVGHGMKCILRMSAMNRGFWRSGS